MSPPTVSIPLYLLQNESTFVQREPITASSLTRFVSNFLSRKLPRYLKSSPTQNTDRSEATAAKTTVSIREINAKSFTSDVLRSNKVIIAFSISPNDDRIRFITKIVVFGPGTQTVFVLFHSTQCALCSVMSQHLLLISRLLGDHRRANVEFVRIDGDRNDLPWQYTMERFPSLVAFATK